MTSFTTVLQNAASTGRLFQSAFQARTGSQAAGCVEGYLSPLGPLIARILLLNPAGLLLTPNWDHNPRLQKLWVFPTFS